MWAFFTTSSQNCFCLHIGRLRRQLVYSLRMEEPLASEPYKNQQSRNDKAKEITQIEKEIKGQICGLHSRACAGSGKGFLPCAAGERRGGVIICRFSSARGGFFWKYFVIYSPFKTGSSPGKEPQRAALLFRATVSSFP